MNSGLWPLEGCDIGHPQSMLLVISCELFLLYLCPSWSPWKPSVELQPQIEPGKIHDPLLGSELPWKVSQLAEGLWEGIINFMCRVTKILVVDFYCQTHTGWDSNLAIYFTRSIILFSPQYIGINKVEGSEVDESQLCHLKKWGNILQESYKS